MSNVTIIRPKSREEWLEIRKSGIGSSEVATIVGLNPWETPYQLWRRKTGLDEPKQENAAMRNGHHLEDAVSRMWHDATGREIIKRSATRMKVDPEDLPKYWFAQVQYQLGVAGYTQGSLAWLSAGQGFDFGYQDLKLVPDFFEWLIDSVSRFWTDNIVGGQEPSAVNVADVLIKYNRHTGGKIVECSEEVFSAYQDLKVVKKELDALKERKESLEATLKMAFEDAEALSYGGDTIATWKAPKPSNKFDDKAFVAEHPDLAAAYTHQVQGARRLLLK